MSGSGSPVPRVGRGTLHSDTTAHKHRKVLRVASAAALSIT